MPCESGGSKHDALGIDALISDTPASESEYSGIFKLGDLFPEFEHVTTEANIINILDLKNKNKSDDVNYLPS